MASAQTLLETFPGVVRKKKKSLSKRHVCLACVSRATGCVKTKERVQRSSSGPGPSPSIWLSLPAVLSGRIVFRRRENNKEIHNKAAAKTRRLKEMQKKEKKAV